MDIDQTLLKCGNSFLPVCNMVFAGFNVQNPSYLFKFKLFFKLELFRLQLADNVEHRLARYANAAYIRLHFQDSVPPWRMTCQQPLQANPLLAGYPGADEACIPPTDQLSMHAPSFSCCGKECAHSELHQKENQSSWDRVGQLPILL